MNQFSQFTVFQMGAASQNPALNDQFNRMDHENNNKRSNGYATNSYNNSLLCLLFETDMTPEEIALESAKEGDDCCYNQRTHKEQSASFAAF